MTLDIPFGPRFVQRVRFTRGAFDPSNPVLSDLIEPREDGPVPALVIVDSGVANAAAGLAGRIESYLAAHPLRARLAGKVRIVQGGEAAKNDRSCLDAVISMIHEARLCRRSYVIAVGGGAVLDVVGLAAMLAHRGVRLIRLPTTTLAQADSGVAVKNGINAFGTKNYLGAFAPAWGIVNDSEFLTTLSDRDWRSGFSEAAKVALVKDAAFFDRLARDADAIARRDASASQYAIQRTCELHARHICEGGDPFEQTHARPLDFGHWAAHRLESMTGYALRHGEAVAIGIAIDTRYSVLAGLLPEPDGARVVRCLQAFGFDLAHAALEDTAHLLDGIEQFREHLGGRLTIAMLAGMGRGVDVHQIDPAKMRAAIAWVRTLSTTAGPRFNPEAEGPPHIPVFA